MFKHNLKTFFKNKLNLSTICFAGAFVLFGVLSYLHFIFSYVSLISLGMCFILIGVIVQKKHKTTKIILKNKLKNEINENKVKRTMRKNLLPLKFGFIVSYIMGVYFIYYVSNIILLII